MQVVHQVIYMILVIKVTAAGLPLITLKDHFYSQVHQLTMKQALSLASVWICDDGLEGWFQVPFQRFRFGSQFRFLVVQQSYNMIKFIAIWMF